MRTPQLRPLITSRGLYARGRLTPNREEIHMRTVAIFVQTLVGGIGIGSLYALVALGYSMVYRSMGLVNFAHGSIYMIGTYFGMIFYMGLVGTL